MKKLAYDLNKKNVYQSELHKFDDPYQLKAPAQMHFEE